MAADPAADERPQTKPFAAFVQEQGRGRLHSELSDGFAELVAACMEHEKAGTLTLTIKVKPSKDGESVQISDDLKIKAPEADRSPSVFFTDRHGNVSRNNPRQDELPLREVAGRRAGAARHRKGR
jgi:hypothetical protein